ncbi:GMC family oxidoreductase [Amycolatopsis sp. WQ 127309]|uniref:GMC family oxidoreductase n=1 Tax=Amycolatopsis sp. WQ 127309 TaxID=2932773 RepID=UPI001FF15BFF|nr:GMC family oxidoreductase [Amycolatopsis sp. WQ 127309]UOZ03464.1 GMC family oxidoreductase [Amycolatopsis sp. WQ 127309]
MLEYSCETLVIGGGSAGCAAVHSLLRSGVDDVVLAEAGPDHGPATAGGWHGDLLDARVVPESHDWGYWSQYGDRKTFAHARAKVLGGCSTFNEAHVVWGRPDEYDRWARLWDEPGWSWKGLRDDIDAVELSEPASDFHGRAGMLETAPHDEAGLTQWSRGFLTGALEAGYARLPDFGAPAAEGGVAIWRANQRGTTRWNTAFAFLDPHRDDHRLRIVDGLTITGLRFRGDRAVAAHGMLRGQRVTIRARSFVLAAGAVGTPELLLRSGVGPAAALERLGIDVVSDVPAVGRGLTDHIGVSLAYQLTGTADETFRAELSAGPVPHCQTVARVPLGSAEDGSFNLLPYERTFDGVHWVHALIAFLVTPASSGGVTLVSPDVRVPPRIDAGYLNDPDGRDLTRLRRGLGLIRELVERSDHLRGLVLPGDDGPPAGGDLDSHIRQTFFSYGHLMSSCRIGTAADRSAAATPDGRVKGLGNVVVADASAIPGGFAAATHLTTMLFGYRLARSAVH